MPQPGLLPEGMGDVRRADLGPIALAVALVVFTVVFFLYVCLGGA